MDETAFGDLKGQFDGLLPVGADYPIPDIPSRLHDVATMREGRNVRPRIPTSRTTVDGRIGVGMPSYVGKRVDIPGGRAVSFYLYTPEKLAQKGTHVSQAADGSSDMMASKVFWVHESEFLGGLKDMGMAMIGVCDSTLAQMDKELYGKGPGGIHRNPYPVNETDDGYDFHLFSSNRNNLQQIYTIPIRVIVSNAKTPQAQIKRIERLGPPKVALLPNAPLTIFEPTIAGDGRLLVYRTSGTPGQGGGADSLKPRAWTDNEGTTRNSQFDIVYSYNNPAKGMAPCDPQAWVNPRPITYAHHDAPVRAQYGFAKFPFRDAEGRLLGPGEESGMTYPWIDSRGANLFFTAIYRLRYSDESTFATNEDFEMVQTADSRFNNMSAQVSNATQQTGISRPELRPHLMLPSRHVVPVPGACKSACTDTTPTEHVSSTRGVAVAGLWTEGKMVMLDGLMNATDMGYLAFDEGHRLLRLYHGKGGVVRVGNGRTNTDNLSLGQFMDPYWPLNDSMMETHENKFNYFREWKPASPKDVTWTMSTGRASTEVSFDDFMDPSALILSNMQASLSLNPGGPIKWLKPNTGDRNDRALRLQNAATNSHPAVPPFGAAVGNTKQGTRIEPVALGGIEGKGLWLSADSGIRYNVGNLAGMASGPTPGAYYGVFVDPRTAVQGETPATASNDGSTRWILSTPTGAMGLATNQGQLELVLARTASSETAFARLLLPATVREGRYAHIAINRVAKQLEIYINGFLWHTLAAEQSGNAFVMQAGIIQLGGDTQTKGQRGWYDNLEVFNRSVIDAEEACIRAMGSLIRVQGSGGANSAWPASSHRRIAQAIGEGGDTQFECHRNDSDEGWGFLSKVPESQRVGHRVRRIKPLVFGQARPAETDNTFCVSCHRTPHPSSTMSLDALTAKNLPMQFDPRRQPLQPKPTMTGVVPGDWARLNFRGLPASQAVGGYYEKPQQFLLMDSVLNSTGR